jgi:phosphoheptose isomerase
MASDDPATIVRAELQAAAEALSLAADSCGASVVQAADLLAASLQAGGKILLCGNGGSAADCQHLAAEFVNVLRKDAPRPPMAAVALTTDTSILTASANDFGFEGVFARQVEALARPGDVLIGLSTSGASKNVVRAMRVARDAGVSTVALTAGTGGKVAALADVAILAPGDTTRHVQEAHIAICHAICLVVERALHSQPAAGAP